MKPWWIFVIKINKDAENGFSGYVYFFIDIGI